VTPYEPVGWNVPQSRFRRFLPTILVVTVVLAIGFIGLSGQGGPEATPPPLPASPVEGVVVAVDSPSLGEVRAFAVRTTDGLVFDLQLGPLENATEFSPSHLGEHMATSQPILAYYRLQAGTPVVYRLEDAPPAAT
jgi:hypothetical protein